MYIFFICFNSLLEFPSVFMNSRCYCVISCIFISSVVTYGIGSISNSPNIVYAYAILCQSQCAAGTQFRYSFRTSSNCLPVQCVPVQGIHYKPAQCVPVQGNQFKVVTVVIEITTVTTVTTRKLQKLFLITALRALSILIKRNAAERAAINLLP